jgi:hypothetical protein
VASPVLGLATGRTPLMLYEPFEEKHSELKERRTDLAVALLIQTVRQVDAPDFATKRRRKRCHLDGAANKCLRCSD